MPSLIIIVSAIGMLVLFVLWRVSNSLEKVQARKIAKLNKYKNYISRLQRMFDRIPSCYLSQEVKLLLLNDLITNLHHCKKLDPESIAIKENLAKREQQMEAAAANAEKTRVMSFKNPKEATELRRRLLDLHKYVANAKKTRRMEKDTASEELKNLKHLFLETATHSFINQAKNAEAQQKSALAIHYYNRAIKEYQSDNHTDRYSKKLQELISKVEEINQKSSKRPKSQEQNALTAGLDEMLNEEKKQTRSRHYD